MSKPPKKGRGKKAVLRKDELAVKPRVPNEPPAVPKRPARKPSIGRGDPKTLSELWERVKRSLYATIDGLCALPKDIVGGTRQIIQQVPEYTPELIKSALVTPRIAEAIAKRIERGDKQEAKAQEKAATRPVPEIAPPEAEQNLEAILAAFQAKGLAVEIAMIAGVPTIIAVRPELMEAARAIATTATVPPAASGAEKI